MIALWVATGGFFGALFRYQISQRINKRFSSSFPYGTLTVNILGSFLLGWMHGKGIGGNISLFLGTGFMGAFTTFSTFKLENVQLSQRKQWPTSAIYIGVSYILGISLAYLGFLFGAMKG